MRVPNALFNQLRHTDRSDRFAQARQLDREVGVDRLTHNRAIVQRDKADLFRADLLRPLLKDIPHASRIHVRVLRPDRMRPKNDKGKNQTAHGLFRSQAQQAALRIIEDQDRTVAVDLHIAHADVAFEEALLTHHAVPLQNKAYQTTGIE